MQNNDKKVLLRISNLKQYFPLKGGRFVKANDGISLDIYEGETFGLVGESGCGKSTLGRTILQLYHQTYGRTMYYGRSLDDLAPKYVIDTVKNLKSRRAKLHELEQKRDKLEAEYAKLSETEQYAKHTELDTARKLAEDALLDITKIVGGFLVVDDLDPVIAAYSKDYGIARKISALEEKRQALQRNLDGVSVQLRTLEAKANMLREMERDFEGFSKAVRLVMQEAARGALSGVHGPVSKLIRVEDRYTTAIETALGAAMQNIIVDDEASGKAAIQLLKRRDAGRATFLPLSTVTGRRLSEPSLANMPGCRRCLRACADRRAVSGNPGKSSGKNRDCRDAGQRHCDGEKNGKPRTHCHARRTGHEPRRQYDGRLERKERGRSV